MKRNNFSSRKRNSTKIFVATTLFIAAIAGGSIYLFNQRNEVVVAKINDQKIFKSDIEKKLKDVFDGQDQEVKAPEIEKLPKEVIEILAKEIYLEKELTKEAKQSKITRNPETRDKIDEAKSRILRQTYLDSILKAEISEEKISEKFSELTNDLDGKKEYQIFHIVLPTKEEAQKVAQELKAKKAPKFSELAKKYSIDKTTSVKGGDLGYILEDNMIKEIADVISDLKTNEVSDPIQTKFGWHLVKINDVRDVKIPEFESVKGNIRDQLIQNKINEINNRIIKDAKIKILIKLQEPEDKKEEVVVEEAPIQEEAPAQEAVATEEVVLEEPIAEEAEVVGEKKSEKKSEKKADKKKSASKKSNEKHQEKKSK